jgi:hypothetical protein
VQTINGGLTINSQSDGSTPGNFTISNDEGDGLVLVSHASALVLTGQTITNRGTIEVDGFLHVVPGATLQGDGYVVLESGGHVAVEGTVAAQQHIDFDDGTGLLTIDQAPLFSGQINLTASGARIDLTGVAALSASYEPSSSTLVLYAGTNQTGATLAQLHVTGTSLDTTDFKLSSDGGGGTLVTYIAEGVTHLYQPLPVPVVAPTGTMVSLSSMLMQSFGTDNPGFYGMTLFPAPHASAIGADVGYWVEGAGAVTPRWYVNGNPITSEYVVQPGDDVALSVGNAIKPPSIRAQVTPAATGPSAEFVTYDVYTVDPAVSAQVPGTLTPAAEIASAHAYDSVFGPVPNTNFCYVIADNVAAGLGAPIASQWDYSLTPALRLDGGFWRMVYDGSTSPTPVVNWSTLVQPGDIVGMDWLNNTSGPVGEYDGHTTTVLAGGGPGNTAPITVYDNVLYQPDGSTAIGIHQASYWNFSDPATVIIYRLDPNQQYLIRGTSLAEVIQGSVYDNLIQPGGGADIITGGPGDSEFQDTAAHLNGITVTDFNFGDQLDFTDLNPAQVTTAHTGTTLQVFSNNVEVAAITLPGVAAGQTFVATPDGNGGSLVELDLMLGHFGAPTFELAAFGANAGGWSSDDTYPRELADVNGDGMADIVGFGQAGVWESLATGGGHFAMPTFELAAFGANAGGWSSDDTFPRELADVNGDGMADIVGFGQAGVWESLATGGGHFAAPTFELAAFGVNAGDWTSDDLYPRTLADVNGDGRADIVGFGQAGVFVSLATAGGHFAAPTFELAAFGANAGSWTSDDLYPRTLADVNADGMADIVGFGQAGVFVSLATGDGHFAAPMLDLASFGVGAGGWSTDNIYPRELADVTGNGQADIVGFSQAGVLLSQFFVV